jgi:hypothetical protein
MGHVTCGIHRASRCCWRCDRCPSCNEEVGRLLRGDYCRRCVGEMKGEGLAWSEYYQDYIQLHEPSLFGGGMQ